MNYGTDEYNSQIISIEITGRGVEREEGEDNNLYSFTYLFYSIYSHNIRRRRSNNCVNYILWFDIYIFYSNYIIYKSISSYFST